MQRIESGDPVERAFDRLLALTAYGLLFVSVFLFWWPAPIAVVIAWVRREGADPRTASHFRLQVLIFWTQLALFALGLMTFLAAGSVAVSELWRMAGAGEFDWSGWSAAAGGTTAALVVVGVLLLLLSALSTLGLSAWGALRLVTGDGIGQRPRP